MMPCPGCGPWGGMWGWGPWWWGLVMLVFWILILIGLVLLIIWLIRQFTQASGAGGRSGTNRALEILQERYARGEITREEYEAMRRDLLGGSSS
jgi:putative membrane protein